VKAWAISQALSIGPPAWPRRPLKIRTPARRTSAPGPAGATRRAAPRQRP